MTLGIKQAAVKLYKKQGSSFTVDDLQAITGASRATLYRRIGNKEALLLQLAQDGLIEFSSEEGVEAQIFEATRKVVAQEGFINTTMEQIANEAGLGVATLYRHFKDKENLFVQFIASLNPKLAFKAILNQDENDLERQIKDFIDVALKFLNENRDLVKLRYSWQKAEQRYFEHLRQETTTNFAELVYFFKRQRKLGNLRQDISVEDMAINLNGMLMQYAIYAPIHHNRKLDIDEDAKTILELFLHGVRHSD